MTDGYIKIRDLLDFCANQKDHSITPNDIMRMNRVSWISVKDKLPEAEVTVLAVKQLKDGRREICLARCIPEFTFYDYRTDREVTEPRWVCGGNNNILYWMPLPEPPKEG